MAELKLAIFDVDGTLIDSLAHIKWAMNVAFEAQGVAKPAEQDIRGIIGLSLPVAMARLAPDLDEPARTDLVRAYGEAFKTQAEAKPDVSFFDGALDVLNDLARRDEVLLGVATGKSRRGMDRILNNYQLGKLFQTVQVADDHPSKPHPSMIEAALSETGVEAENAVIIGDTSFDMEMGRLAGISTIGVRWGYHEDAALAPFADHMIDGFGDLDAVLETVWQGAQ
jgi:phosphoglycolate phosphatase